MIRVSLSLDPHEWQDAGIRTAWAKLIAESPHALFASSTWFDHLRRNSGDEGLGLVLCRDSDNTLVGLAPVQLRRTELEFNVGVREVFSVPLTVANFLGSEPPVPPPLLPQVCDAVFGSYPQCDALYMEALPAETLFWSKLGELDGIVYVPNGTRPWHLIELGTNADKYYSTMSGKTRATLRRKQRRIEEELGKIEVLRVDKADQVSSFIEDAIAIGKNSWQQELLGARITKEHVSTLTDLSNSGILRSYLLKCGERPCAFVVGYQYSGCYYYEELAFDSELSHYSPGTVLLDLIVRDLFAFNTPRVLDFGVGTAEYKQRFGTLLLHDATVFIFAPTLRNRAVMLGHSAFRGAIRGVRRLSRALPALLRRDISSQKSSERSNSRIF